MIDIFNIDKMNPDIFFQLKNLLKSDFFNEIFYRLGLNGIDNINTYINDEVTQTRGFHVDSYSKQYKVFFYLTDVISFSNGPYTYISGSHLDSSYRKINKLISSKLDNDTETPIFQYANIHPILGLKGSLIISNQSGFHRGFPQDKNAHRVILSLNIR